MLRTEFGQFLLDHGLTDFDISTATSEQLEVTQRIGAWCFDHGFAGIVYMSRLDAIHICWSIYERPEPDPVAFRPFDVRPIADDDPDLLAVVGLFGLPYLF